MRESLGVDGYARKVAEVCGKVGFDPGRWKAGWELQGMEAFLLENAPRLLTRMEDELCIEERKAVAKAVQRAMSAGPSEEAERISEDHARRRKISGSDMRYNGRR